jgi:hypothetical protein
VRARARYSASRHLGTPEQALADEAALFKRVFHAMAVELVRSTLGDLGLAAR